MGTTNILPLFSYNQNDTLFRAWGSAVSAQMAAAGWVQTSDTGQANWATMAFPGVGVSAGYEIWRMNDSLQATVPIFMKLEYGTNFALNTPGMWVTLGSGSNGAGTLTGVLSLRQPLGPQNLLTTPALNWYFSGSTDRFCFMTVAGSATQTMGFSVERTVDLAGDRTAEGALLIVRINGTYIQQAWNAITGPYTAAWEGSVGVLAPDKVPAGVFGSQVAVYPVFHNKGVFLPPGLNMMGFVDGTMSQLSPVTFNVYGSPHTYMPLVTAGNGGFARGGLLAASILAMMRWE